MHQYFILRRLMFLSQHNLDPRINKHNVSFQMMKSYFIFLT